MDYPKTLKDINPDQLYTPAELSYASRIEYPIVSKALREKKISYLTPQGTRIRRVFGKDYLKWLSQTPSK